MILRRAGPGKPSQCLPIASAQLRPVNIVAWPVADCGSPSTPRQASMGREWRSMSRHSAGQTSGLTGLSAAGSRMPSPSMNRKTAFNS